MHRSLSPRIPVLLLSLVALCASAPAARSAGSAQVSGLWCGEGLLREASLQLAQHRQEFDGTLMHRQRSRHVEGSIEGNTLRTMAGKAGELVLQLQGGRLRIVTAAGPLALAQGMGFRRAAGERCG
ncbi:MAG: hypothetical protein ABI409_14820 [Ramlibacter sp.]